MSEEYWLVMSSGNGSGNHGDAMMWEAAVTALRDAKGCVRVVTDGASGWTSPLVDVTVLPFLFTELRRPLGLSPGVLRDGLDLVWRPFRKSYGARSSSRFMEGRKVRASLRRWRKIIEGSEGVIFSGAGAVTDDYAEHGVLSWNLVTRYARRHGRPVAFVGQGLGPIRDQALVAKAREMLELAGLVTVREQESVVQAQSWGVGPQPVLTPDWALVARVSEDDRIRAKAAYSRVVGDHERSVAVVVHRRHAIGQNDLLETQVTDLILLLVKDGFSVVLVPNAVGRGGNDDIAYLRAFMSRNGLPQKVGVVDHATTPGESRALLGMFDAVVSTRYHALIFALSESVPAIGLSMDPYYDQKLRGALGWFGLEENFHALSAVSGVEISSQIERIAGSRLPDGRVEELATLATGPLRSWLEVTESEVQRTP